MPADTTIPQLKGVELIGKRLEKRGRKVRDFPIDNLRLLQHSRGFYESFVRVSLRFSR